MSRLARHTVGDMGSGTTEYDLCAREVGELLALLGVNLLTGGGGGVMSTLASVARWTNDRCQVVDKIKYLNVEAVKRGVRGATRKGAPHVTSCAYRCPHCGWYHSARKKHGHEARVA